MSGTMSKAFERKKLAIKFVRADLEEIFLSRVLKGPVHGYSFIAEVKDRYGVFFGPSTIYPLINSLEENGYVSSQWRTDTERPRKEYHHIPIKTRERLELIVQEKEQAVRKTKEMSKESLSVQTLRTPTLMEA